MRYLKAMANNHLSTASASWALFALGLNAATQDCGPFLWSQSEWNFLLRATPWGCCLDTARLIAMITIGTISHKSVGTALQDAAVVRGQHKSRSETRKRTRIEAIILIAAISQLVKLMSCSGPLLVKGVAMVYTTAYVLQLFVNNASSPEVLSSLRSAEPPSRWRVFTNADGNIARLTLS